MFAEMSMPKAIKIADRLCRNGRMDFHDQRDVGDTRDRRDVVDKIETEFFVKRCVARIRRRGEE